MEAHPIIAEVFVLLVVAAFWWGVGLLIGLSLARWLTIRAEQIRHEKQRALWKSEAEGKAWPLPPLRWEDVAAPGTNRTGMSTTAAYEIRQGGVL